MSGHRRIWGISLQAKLLAAFGSLAALVVIGGVLALASSASVKTRQDLTTDAARRIHLSDEIARINAEILGAEKDMILGGLTANQPLLDRSTTRLQQLVTEGGDRTAALAAAMATPQDRAQATVIRDTMDRVSTRCDECHAVVAGPGGVRANLGAVLTLAENSEALLVANRTNVQTLQQRQQIVFNQSAAEGNASYRQARATSVATGSVALAVAVLVLLGVRRLTRDLRRTAEALRAGAAQVHTAADTVTTSSQSLSNGANAQAASLQETSASMEEMSAMTKQNAAHAARSAGLVSEVTERAAESDGALHRMEGSMQAIQSSAMQMSRIIKTIDEIAFQTNILALNAAVEAARAGDVGLGFAVVADEVRNLAQRSASAAKDTAQLIEQCTEDARAGAEHVTRVSSVMRAMAADVGRIQTLVTDVTHASHQQAQGIVEITRAIAQMEHVTEQNTAVAQDTAAAAAELTSEAEASLQLVAALETLVEGRTSRPTTQRPSHAASGATRAPRKDAMTQRAA